MIHKLSQIAIHTCIQMIQLFVINMRIILEIQNVLNKIFAKTYNWFVDSKLFGDHFGECMTKCILFTSEKNYQSLTQHTITI